MGFKEIWKDTECVCVCVSICLFVCFPLYASIYECIRACVSPICIGIKSPRDLIQVRNYPPTPIFHMPHSHGISCLYFTQIY